GIELPLDQEIARSERARVTLRSLAVFSTGVEVTLLAEWLPGTLELPARGFVALPQSPQFLRLAFEYADGRRATNMDDDAWPDDDEVPDSPLTFSDDVFAFPGHTHGTLDAWIWGIPETGDPAVVIEWPAADIPVVRLPLDGDAIRAAARASTETTPPIAT